MQNPLFTEKPELEILYQDDHLVAVNKPAGLLVHRSMIDRFERFFALQLVRDQISRHVFPIHRLDKPTSGVLLFALSPEIARRVCTQFEQGWVSKEYLAVVRGHTEETLLIDYPLKEELDKMTDALADPDKAPQEAVTEIQTLNRAELPIATGRYASSRYSLIRARPRTGRKHQIRRHLKHVFHPIVGDTTYGDGKHNQTFRRHLECHRLLLAATGLRLRHPVSDQALALRAEPGADFLRVIEALGWRNAPQPQAWERPQAES